MSIKITMEFKSINETIALLKQIDKDCGFLSRPTDKESNVVLLPASPELSPPDPEPGKEEAANTGGITKDDVRKALSKCLDEAGHDVALQILQDHGAEKRTDLTEDQYISYVIACDTAVADVKGG